MTASSTDPKWSPTKRTALPGTTASAMSSGVSRLEPLVDVGGRDAPASGRPRGSSGRRGGTRSGRGVRGPSGRWRRRGPADCRGRTRRATGRPDGGCAAPGPRGPGASRYQRSPASSANRKHGPSGSRQASHDDREQETAADAHASASTGRRRRAPVVGVTSPRPRRVRVRPAGLHLARAPLEVGALLGGRRPDRLEAVPLSGAGRDRSGRARRRSRWVARWRSAGSDERDRDRLGRTRPGGGRPAGGW